jgi:tetratricopeptide (TPR) repeat protein
MAERHVSADLFRRFLDGKVAKQEAKRIVRHLIHGCEDCLALSSRIVAEAGYWFPKRGLVSEAEYEDAFASAFRFATAEERRAALARVRGWGQWAPLERFLPEERLQTVLAEKHFHHWGFYRALLDAARRYSRTDPREAVNIVSLAMTVAELLDAATIGGPQALGDLRAMASGNMGNVKRLAGDLDGAREALNNAWALLEEGSGDPLERAHLLSLDASYARTVGEFEMAESILRDALHIYRSAGDLHMQGRILIQMGDAIGYINPARGIEYIEEALGLVNTSREPRLELCAQHDLAFFLTDAGRPEEALAVFDRARPLYKQFPDDWAQLRQTWMEGKIARGFNHLEEASQIYRQVWEVLRDRELTYDLLMVSLDLAECYVASGHYATAARFAAEVYEVMRGSQVNHYTMAAWLVLRNAIELHEATDILKQVRRHYLRHFMKPAEFVGE